jgi:hypothetical protein
VRAIHLAHAARAEGGENLIRAESSAGGEGQLSWIIRARQQPGRDYSGVTALRLLGCGEGGATACGQISIPKRRLAGNLLTRSSRAASSLRRTAGGDPH